MANNAAAIRQKIWLIRTALNALELMLEVPDTPTTPQKRAEMAFPALFEEFWGLYPERRRKGKMAAFRAWKANVTPDDAGQRAVIGALKSQLGQKDWVKEGGQYVPMPTTWLNQHRWLDAVEGGGENGSGKYGGLGETL